MMAGATEGKIFFASVAPAIMAFYLLHMLTFYSTEGGCLGNKECAFQICPHIYQLDAKMASPITCTY
jgi:hypothetical protein